MAAGLATLTRILTKDAYPKLHALADSLTAGCQAVLDEYELPGYAINVGPKGQWTLSVQHTEEEVDRHVAVFREFASQLNA